MITKKRVNISIGEQLHEASKNYSRSLGMDLSELLSTLLREEISGDTPRAPRRPKSEQPVAQRKKLLVRIRGYSAAKELPFVAEDQAHYGEKAQPAKRLRKKTG